MLTTTPTVMYNCSLTLMEAIRQTTLSTQKTTTYREQSRIFLAQAREELAKGDLPQASEKGWGAAAQIVKANADKRGWNHFSHWTLQRAVSDLSEEAGDPEFTTLFGSAEALHVNFYENGYTAKAIENYLRRVEQFVQKAEGLLNATH